MRRRPATALFLIAGLVAGMFAAACASDAAGDIDDDAVDFDSTTGASIASHESFWFAWSQFHPSTEPWER